MDALNIAKLLQSYPYDEPYFHGTYYHGLHLKAQISHIIVKSMKKVEPIYNVSRLYISASGNIHII